MLAIVVMTKYPAAGRVKTRLTPALAPQQAADVHAALLRHGVARLASLAAEIDGRVFVCFDPPDAARPFHELLPDVPPAQFLPQSPGDLGARLAAAAEAVRRGWNPSGMLFFGVDSPDLPADHVRRAASLCRNADVVLGPTDDGGYWCVGVGGRVEPARLFAGIEWSTGREMAQTVERAGDLGYTAALADPWDDVDRPADLARLIERLSRSPDAADGRLLAALRAACPGEILQ